MKALVAVFLDGEYKVAQIVCSDGYPSFTGVAVLTLIRDQRIRREPLKHMFADKVRACASLKTQPKPIPASEEPYILDKIRDADKPFALDRKIEFAAHSYACRWVYVVDLDKETFEAYVGRNLKPLDPMNERFAWLGWPDLCEAFQPVRHVKTWRLVAPPTNRDFLQTLAGVKDGC